MILRLGRRLIAGGVAAALCAGPASGLADEAAGLRRPNLRPELTSVEAGLWGAADKAEAYLKSSADVNRDPGLNAYVRQVVCRIAEEYCNELRVYVLDRPTFNATAAPNGYLEVNSGLLLRARSEDELAYVLGHEISHFARNHSLAIWNHHKSTANMVLALQVGVTLGAAAAMYSTAASGSPNAGSTIDSISRSAQALNNLIYLQGIASYFAFSREQESEADRLGFGLATAAGYDKGGGPRLWGALVSETKASDFEKVRKSESRASMFNTHPLTAERIAALAALGGGAGRAVQSDAESRYRAVMRPHLQAWLRDDLRRRDFGQTLFVIGRLEASGQDLGLLSFFRGEALRQRRGDGDAAAALQAYRAAVAYPDAPAVAWRELGEAERKAGDRKAAAKAFETYLAKAPGAEDAWLVQASLKSVESTEGR